ncbi:hypothetical protein DCC81_03790 [Chitinophaga parva]|uniref:Uncharacterized protein n=1 Tax=Chitinophaga parva TaxID=2169414 RepID=A0A2T7BLQ7_9BACT|nr:hypothetical protein DCC81_03790 [Chitinophaga parva]
MALNNLWFIGRSRRVKRVAGFLMWRLIKDAARVLKDRSYNLAALKMYRWSGSHNDGWLVSIQVADR